MVIDFSYVNFQAKTTFLCLQKLYLYTDLVFWCFKFLQQNKIRVLRDLVLRYLFAPLYSFK